MVGVPQDNRHVNIYDIAGNKLSRLPRESGKCHMRMVSSVAWAGEGDGWRGRWDPSSRPSQLVKQRSIFRANLFSVGFDRLAMGWRVRGKEEAWHRRLSPAATWNIEQNAIKISTANATLNNALPVKSEVFQLHDLNVKLSLHKMMTVTNPKSYYFWSTKITICYIFSWNEGAVQKWSHHYGAWTLPSPSPPLNLYMEQFFRTNTVYVMSQVNFFSLEFSS